MNLQLVLGPFFFCVFIATSARAEGPDAQSPEVLAASPGSTASPPPDEQTSAPTVQVDQDSTGLETRRVQVTTAQGEPKPKPSQPDVPVAAAETEKIQEKPPEKPVALADADSKYGYRVLLGIAPIVPFHSIGRGGAPGLAAMPYVAYRLSGYNDDITRLYCAVESRQNSEVAQNQADLYAKQQTAYRRKTSETTVTPTDVEDETDWTLGEAGSCGFKGLRGVHVYAGGIVPYGANITDEGTTLKRSVNGGVSTGLLWNFYGAVSLLGGWSLLVVELPRGAGTRTRIVGGPVLGIGLNFEIGKALAGKI